MTAETPTTDSLPFPYPYPSPPASIPGRDDQHYGVGGLPAPRSGDARHMPVYHDGPRLLVGVDQGAEHTGSLPEVGRRGDITVRHGRVNDGAGRATVSAYLVDTVDDPGLRYMTAPIVRLGGAATTADFSRLARAVQLVNVALPEGRKMSIERDAAFGGGVNVRLVPEAEFNGSHWGATFNSNSGPGNQITQSDIYINSAYSRYGDRQAVILLAHELLHALGMFGGDGHVSPDIDSILEGTRDIYATAQDAPQPLSLLYPADREALRALYGRLENGDDPTAFGPWSDASWHVAGHGQHAAFGVALRNGHAEPWAYGYRPAADLAGNRELSGSATWSGTLLGLTPDAAAVAGDAQIGVHLATLTGRADFTGLEMWPALSAPGDAGTGTMWGDGDLGYIIAVRGNTFRETGGDDGRLTGIFVGRHHEGAAGTLERADLTAAFGATRDAEWE
ncbi:MAG: hypothetical protein OXQ28_00245 [Acidobacteriota bacterium]|nr:hypothetical protein [Acidobacteriota bacterium]